MNMLKKFTLVAGLCSLSAMAADGLGVTAPDGIHVGVNIGGPGYYHGRTECRAVNERGRIFIGVAHNPRRAQDEAMNRCYRHSRACRPAGCN